MSQIPQNGLPPTPSGHSDGPVRKSVLVLVVGVVLMAVLGLGIYFHNKPALSSTNPSVETVTPAKTNAGEEEPVLVQSETNLSHIQAAPAGTIMSNFAAVPAKAAAVDTKPNRLEPSPYTKQLMKILSDIDPKAPMTEEKAGQWKQALQQLVQEGARALPAIQEFLDKNEDLKLDSGSGTNLVGEPTLRTALIKALDSIGGPEAVAFEAQWLQSTADPNEIALLARQLEKQAPQQYRQMAVEAAQAALAMASSGKLPDRDMGPLFGILQQYGDSNATDYLKSLMNNWKYYGAITLSQLPNGAGVPTLVDMVKDTEPGPTRNVGFWMLAQDVDSDLAQSTLLDQAKNSGIPCPTWIEISSILSGNDFHIGSAATEGRLPRPGERSWHLNSGNQNFYSTPRTDPWTAEQINRRLVLLDQLLAANKSCPDAVSWLQKARADLLSKLAPNP